MFIIAPGEGGLYWGNQTWPCRQGRVRWWWWWWGWDRGTFECDCFMNYICWLKASHPMVESINDASTFYIIKLIHNLKFSFSIVAQSFLWPIFIFWRFTVVSRKFIILVSFWKWQIIVFKGLPSLATNISNCFWRFTVVGKTQFSALSQRIGFHKTMER